MADLCCKDRAPYDDRSSAHTLSLDNWGRRATANPGAPWRGPADDQLDHATWDGARRFYGVGGLNPRDYDRVFARRNPKGRFFASDVAELNTASDQVRAAGGICYAMWHPDRYLNSVLHDPRPGMDGVQGSTLVQHLRHVSNRKEVWYVANGWLYCYHYVAENAVVKLVEAGDRSSQ